MEWFLMSLPWLFGGIIGFTVFYFVIRAAVCDGTVDAAKKAEILADKKRVQ